MDRIEFERLALEHLDAVYRMAFHLTRNQESAEDLTQEVYVRALRPKAVDGFQDRTAADGSGGMRSWLFTICHNVFYSQVKREAKAPVAMGELHGASATEQLPDDPPPAWDMASLDWEQVDERLKAAIENLRPEFREVLLLWGVEGLKYREIGEILGVPIGTVMSRLHRARQAVTRALGSDPEAASELGIRAGGSGKG
jgi:RNA polymerase sigma-70 factor (ECF subfamily)